MKQIGNLNFYTFEEVLDEQMGKIGTPRRDEHEKKLKRLSVPTASVKPSRKRVNRKTYHKNS